MRVEAELAAVRNEEALPAQRDDDRRVAQLLHADFAVGRTDDLVLIHDDDERLIRQHDRLVDLGVHLRARDGDLDDAVVEQLQDARALGLPDLIRDLRVAAVELGDELRQQQCARRRDCPELDRAGDAGADLRDLTHRPVDHAEDVLDARVEHAPRIRQADAPATALEELHAERSLQPLHLARERRLRNVEALCRMTDVALFHDGIECPHILDFHSDLSFRPEPSIANIHTSYISFLLLYFFSQK